MTTILDGQKLSEKILKEIESEVRGLKKAGHQVRLGIILLGKNKASQTYVAKKKEDGKKIGIEVDVITQFPDNATKTPKRLRNYLSRLFKNKLRNIDGVIVQLPLPKDIRETKHGANKTQEILNAIPPSKDVDLLTTTSHGKLFDDRSSILPPTLSGILKLLEEYDISIQGKHVLFVGTGILVGKPGMIVFKKRGATVSAIDEFTDKKAYAWLLKNADIIISGVGKPGIITGDMLGDEQIIIDAGYGESKGDVDFESVSTKASYITPVPGGVGPMTVAMLFWNLVYLTKQQLKK